MSSSRLYISAAALMGFLGVALGAFGAHALDSTLESRPGASEVFQTASEYHLVHALALLGTAWVIEQRPGRSGRWAGYAFIAGVLLFSGSLYGYSVFNIRWLVALTPIGGATLMLGWLMLGIAAWRGSHN